MNHGEHLPKGEMKVVEYSPKERKVIDVLKEIKLDSETKLLGDIVQLIQDENIVIITYKSIDKKRRSYSKCISLHSIQ